MEFIDGFIRFIVQWFMHFIFTCFWEIPSFIPVDFQWGNLIILILLRTQISWFFVFLHFWKKNEKCTLFNMFCPQQPVDEWEGHFESIMLIIIIIIKVIMCGLISKTLVPLLLPLVLELVRNKKRFSVPNFNGTSTPRWMFGCKNCYDK